MARICEWFAMMVSTKQDLLFLPAHYHRNSTSWVQSICKVTEKKMTKADLVSRISDKTGIERQDVQATVEAFMESVRDSLESGHNVYLRGFGSSVIKKRAKKTGRDILKNKTIEIPAHNIPSFKPAKSFMENVKTKVAAK